MSFLQEKCHSPVEDIHLEGENPESVAIKVLSARGRFFLLSSIDHWEFQDLLVCYCFDGSRMFSISIVCCNRKKHE